MKRQRRCQLSQDKLHCLSGVFDILVHDDGDDENDDGDEDNGGDDDDKLPPF